MQTGSCAQVIAAMRRAPCTGRSARRRRSARNRRARLTSPLGCHRPPAQKHCPSDAPPLRTRSAARSDRRRLGRAAAEDLGRLTGSFVAPGALAVAVGLERWALFRSARQASDNEYERTSSASATNSTSRSTAGRLRRQGREHMGSMAWLLWFNSVPSVEVPKVLACDRVQIGSPTASAPAREVRDNVDDLLLAGVAH